MGKVVYTKNEFMVIANRRGHVIINMDGKYHNHGHIRKLSTCKMLIGLIDKKIIPDSNYLRETCLRICLDKKYIKEIENKIDKEKQKPKLIKVNRGVRR